jgi:ribosomal protein L32
MIAPLSESGKVPEAWELVGDEDFVVLVYVRRRRLAFSNVGFVLETGLGSGACVDCQGCRFYRLATLRRVASGFWGPGVCIRGPGARMIVGCSRCRSATSPYFAGFTGGQLVRFEECVKMLPTHRQSHGRSRRRRSHDALTAQMPTICPLSGMPKMHHRVSAESGYVRPGLVIRVKKLGIGVSKD